MKVFTVTAWDISYLLNFINKDMTEEEIEEIMNNALEEDFI